MDFSTALLEMKQGKSVSRGGWYGKHHINIIDTAVQVVEGVEGGLDISPFIAISPQNGGCVPWLASQADLLADDWEVLD